ncbi:MAG: GTPase Era [Bacteroidia bacterium]|nr:GTPase Era [Bacteroidia bacterium]
MDLQPLNYPAHHKSGFVSIVGKPNVGKSTLLNALLGQKLCIVTPKAQTTRHRIFGILSEPDYQIVFSDTPGIIKPKYRLHQKMMESVDSAIHDAEVVVVMVDVKEQFQEEELLHKIQKTKLPILLVLNKSDLATGEEIQQRIEFLTSVISCKEVLVISALQKKNLDQLVAAILKYLPEAPPYFDKDQISDRPDRFFISEFVREQIFLHTAQEIPYACEVSITKFEELDNGTVFIDAEIHVERQSQKGMLIGKKGAMVKKIGTAARQEIEAFLEKPVYLQLYVRVAEDWKNSQFFMKQFGYHS